MTGNLEFFPYNSHRMLTREITTAIYGRKEGKIFQNNLELSVNTRRLLNF